MADPIMIQGTMSSAGKSLVAAALCRIFRQDGYRCAPFKSQNMALNSFITREGLEMGRAQVMQAEAAGVEPSVLMNPILLKPTTDRGSQVIVNGEVYGNLSAADYFREKKKFIPEIRKAYEQLAARNDIIVIEGAGSPVELNLLKDDIVNMGMAWLAHSPVLLVGDIDRGGIFAQLLGTLSLLAPDERDMVKGVVVNKFRGDRSLFDDGVRILEQRGGKPVLGVIPYMKLELDDEDSVSEKLGSRAGGVIDIAVVRLPKISNFTDFDVFRQYEGVSVRFVSSPDQTQNPDLLIIPGTKNTVADRNWLRECGFDEKIRELSGRGVPVFGICGGYQIMGKQISDPVSAENGGETDGLGLLDTVTVFSDKKTRRQVSGVIQCREGFFSVLEGLRYDGYEIHMGRSESGDPAFAMHEGGTPDGSVRGNAAGSYVHGLFDSRRVSEALVRALYRRKGLEYRGMACGRDEFRERQFDLLASTVRESIDLAAVYRVIRQGI